jgi:hypothetical protein
MYMLSEANESLQRSLDVIRTNPLPVALIGLGVAWLISNNTGMTDRVTETGRRVTDTATDMGRRVADTGRRVADTGRRVADTASDIGRRAGELATGAAQKVGLAGSDDRALGHTGHPMVDRDGEHGEGWVHQMSDHASGALRSARDTSGALLHKVGSYAGADGVSDAFERHPLVIGAIGVMTGALIAALLPISDVENELLGGTRDELWQRAEDLGEEAVQRVREAATEAAVRAVDAATGAAVESVRQLGEMGEKSSQS